MALLPPQITNEYAKFARGKFNKELRLKSRINFLLPIALAVILPGLAFYAGLESILVNSFGFYKQWFFGSVFLYILWNILWYLSSKKYKLLIIWALVGLGVLVGCLFWQLDFNFKWLHLIRLIVTSLLILTIQYALKAQENISQLLLEKEQIQTENYRVQLQALRAQIDPHFLFNSLNTLRSMVRQQHANSEKFILSLSDFYRQTLKHNDNHTLPLSEELVVLESYLFLMKSRNEQAVQVNLEVDPSLHAFHLPTLALQIVVENCFKHNAMTSKMPLCIEISHTDDLYIVVRNNIQPKIAKSDPSGFGLALLQKRYELMNVKEGLITEQTADQFTVKLKLIRP